jgi:hypothetical protein
MSRKRPGRPPGAKTIREIAEVTPSRCPLCRSSRRSAYENPTYRDYSGQGLPFVGIHYRTCRCLDCGQARRDIEKVYSPIVLEAKISIDHKPIESPNC